MGTFIDSSSDASSSSVGADTHDLVCRITPEDIHKVLLEGYNIVTDSHQSFECRNKEVSCLYQRYRCLLNPFFPQVFRFFRDPLCYEYLIFIGTIGNFAIDVVLYWDLFGWVVLNEGVCFRRYHFGGCSKLQYSVAQRKPLHLIDEKCRFEAKKNEIEAIIANQDFSISPNTFVDWRFKPRLQILEPCRGKKVECEFTLKLCLNNWKLQDCGKSYHLFIDGCFIKKVYTPEPITVDLHHKKKGWHCLEVKLFDECGNYVRVHARTRIYLCKDCCHSSSSSSSTSSGCSSSSSSGCSSSSSSDCSSSSSSDCSSSSSTKYKCKKVSSSSDCSSSSSSSDCSSSSSSSGCSSSSSSSDCDSSSSSSEWICKRVSSSTTSSSSTTTCPSTSTTEPNFYEFQQSFSCPSTCSNSSSSSSADCDPCNGKVKCGRRRAVKCPKGKCRLPLFVRG